MIFFYQIENEILCYNLKSETYKFSHEYFWNIHSENTLLCDIFIPLKKRGLLTSILYMQKGKKSNLYWKKCDAFAISSMRKTYCKILI